MKFYTYRRDLVSYQRYKFFRLKFIIPFLLFQSTIAFIIFILIATFYTTPKEKMLKQDIEYLLYEFDNVNKRMIETEIALDQIKENDSIIYQSLFDVNTIAKKELNVYYEDLGPNKYAEIVESTNQKISELSGKLAKELYRLDGMVKTAYSHQEMLTHIPAIQPIDNKDLKRTASGWGMRIHPIYNIKKFHYGLDFTAPTGTPIYATGDGTIEYVIPSTDKASQGYGNLIIINHGYGFRTLYAHMNKFKSKAGQQVKRGEIIGYVGNTGLSTGPHLHYEVIKDGQKVNPIYYLFNSLTPEEYQKIIQISNSISKSYD